MAVLKFRNLAQDAELGVLCEGLGEVLIDTFANSPAVRKRVRLLERTRFETIPLIRGAQPQPSAPP